MKTVVKDDKYSCTGEEMQLKDYASVCEKTKPEKLEERK